MHQEARFGSRGDQVIANVHAFVQLHTRALHDSKKPQHSAILKDLYACIGREYLRPGDVRRSEVEDEFANVEQLVNTLDLALNQQAIKQEDAAGRHDNSSKKHLIWLRGRAIPGYAHLQSRHDCYVA
jgi:hypothetical protein